MLDTTFESGRIDRFKWTNFIITGKTSLSVNTYSPPQKKKHPQPNMHLCGEYFA